MLNQNIDGDRFHEYALRMQAYRAAWDKCLNRLQVRVSVLRAQSYALEIWSPSIYYVCKVVCVLCCLLMLTSPLPRLYTC